MKKPIELPTKLDLWVLSRCVQFDCAMKWWICVLISLKNDHFDLCSFYVHIVHIFIASPDLWHHLPRMLQTAMVFPHFFCVKLCRLQKSVQKSSSDSPGRSSTAFCFPADGGDAGDPEMCCETSEIGDGLNAEF